MFCALFETSQLFHKNIELLLQVKETKSDKKTDTKGKDMVKKPSPVAKKGGEEEKEPLQVRKLGIFWVITL